MKKAIFFSLVFFLLSRIVDAQIKSGKIVYGVEVNESETQKLIESTTDKAGKAYLIKYINGFKESFPYVKVTLLFNEQESIYKGEKVMKSDNGLNLKMAYQLASPGTYYTNLGRSLTLHQNEFMGNKYLIHKSENFNWNITQKQKIIKGYVCYKATLDFKKDDKIITSTAWFCPSLPFQFGPKEFNGLPGLILEFNYLNRFRFFPKQIEFYNEKIDIQEPEEGKSISKKEFEKILKKHTRFYRE
ncbi:GLPGLI family protein [Mesonia sp.]|uniref:GLPGLI family protein n=1 Tax=Mesonia sp. TaxID=1960830 RepID=UPI003F9872AE